MSTLFGKSKRKRARGDEKAETSAVGRALVFAGWTDSLELSQEEVERSATVASQKKKPTAKKPDRTVVAKKKLVELMGVEAAAEFWRLHQSMTPDEIVQLATGEQTLLKEA